MLHCLNSINRIKLKNINIIYKIGNNVIVWLFNLGLLTHPKNMEPCLVNEGCDIFINGNERPMEERNEDERFETLPSFLLENNNSI